MSENLLNRNTNEFTCSECGLMTKLSATELELDTFYCPSCGSRHDHT